MSEDLDYLAGGSKGFIAKHGDESTYKCPNCGRPKYYVNLSKGVSHCFWCTYSKRIPRFFKKLVRLVKPKQEKTEEKLILPFYSGCISPRVDLFLKSKGMTYTDALGKGWGVVKESGRLFIPIIENGEIKSYVARAVNGENPKEISGPNRSNYLYGYDRVSRGFDIILVEGIFDAEALMRQGYKALALMGSYLSDVQLGKLIRLNPKSVIVMMDGDEAGWLATLKIKRKLMKRMNPFAIKTAITPMGKDPDELARVELDRVLQEAV